MTHRTVLLTGFDTFDGQDRNASWDAVAAVAGAWPGPEELVARRLPVSFRGAVEALHGLLADHTPDVVVCVGEAGGRSAVGIERVALNLADARIPDNDGAAPVDVPVVAGGPTAYLSGLPVKAALVAAAGTGAPVEVSHTAGTYVCNATFYALMHAVAGHPGGEVVAGFVHVPRRPDQVPPGAPSLPTEAAAAALGAVVRACLDVPLGSDVAVSAGTEA